MGAVEIAGLVEAAESIACEVEFTVREIGPRLMGGTQAILVFPNAYGLSIVEGPGTYGVEAATIAFDEAGGWDFVNLFGHDAIYGYTTRWTLSDLIRRVAAAPAAREVGY